jgi:hypothetical protein
MCGMPVKVCQVFAVWLASESSEPSFLHGILHFGISSCMQQKFGPWGIANEEIFYQTPLSFAFVNLKPIVPGECVCKARIPVPCGINTFRGDLTGITSSHEAARRNLWSKFLAVRCCTTSNPRTHRRLR